jgi:hypothetical protein
MTATTPGQVAAERRLVDVYCDESCHLEHDGHPIMVLGAASAEHDSIAELNHAIRALKVEHGYSPDWEIKWTRVSASRLPFYIALVDLFLGEPPLSFRAVVAHGKDQLAHDEFNQVHDEWYYKMYYQLLCPLLDQASAYRIYLDIKDTRGGPKVAKLHEVLANKLHDWDWEIVNRIQIVRSDEVQLMQLSDFLLGAVSYANRGLNTSDAKLAVIRHLEHGAGVNFHRNTRITDTKVNLFHWKRRGTW